MAIAMQNSKHRGFTLIEMVTVVFIIGVLFTMASLSVTQHSDKTLEDEAKRLHALLQLAGEEVVLTSTDLALRLSPTGYEFELFAGDQFQPLEGDKILRKRDFPAEMELELELWGQEVSFADEENPPRIFILSSGEMTPFKLSLTLEDSKPYVVSGDLIGQLALLSPGAQQDDDF